ncbi:ParA family protein [Citromicrobium sp. WPS32]|uniref:ParA family protein n=1 Tax=Citromicrobium sp. WPS32 TaxID=1634517 RepID=UPI0006C93498|nr:ParA family protein [Citromicrobium sp. WPS32]KPM14093.1 chromosome partitioning protein ParA [Citromicrobium sp. WPS32]|tara:strand:- start:3368 stop:4099 length:732 start_codon:yes stop_codon:yes gene_type:complete
MAVVAIYSVKGGVGKTTFATNLAWCAATHSSRRTLLWDLDAAGGAGFLLGVDPKKKKLATSVISKDIDPAKLIRKTGYPRLDLLPADESIRAIDAQLAEIGKKNRIAKLTADLIKDYDRLLLDCPPVLNELSSQIVRAADLIVVPIPPSPLSARALEIVREEVGAEGKKAPPIMPVFSMVDRRRTLHRDAIAASPDWAVIPASSAIELCAARQAPVGAFAPRSPGARAFKTLWTRIERALAKG